MRVSQFIIIRLDHGFDPEAFPPGNLLNLEERDREWVELVVKRADGLFREEKGQVDKEEQVEVEKDRWVDLEDKQDIELGKEFTLSSSNGH